MENPAEDWELLVDGFLEYRRRGVTGSGIAGMHTSKGRENMTQVLKHMVQSINGPIIIAWDAEKQKVAGDLKIRFTDREIVSLQYRDQPGAYNSNDMEWDEHTTLQIEKQEIFFVDQKKEFDVFNRYPELDRHAEVFSYGVLEEYARRGIGLGLMQKALSVLQELQCPLVFGSFVSVYSQKIAEKSGFEAVIRKPYEGNYLNFDDIPQAIREIHKEYAVMVKWL